MNNAGERQYVADVKAKKLRAIEENRPALRVSAETAATPASPASASWRHIRGVTETRTRKRSPGSYGMTLV